MHFRGGAWGRGAESYRAPLQGLLVFCEGTQGVALLCPRLVWGAPLGLSLESLGGFSLATLFLEKRTVLRDGMGKVGIVSDFGPLTRARSGQISVSFLLTFSFPKEKGPSGRYG